MYLGLDLGTSSLKALLIDENEGVIAEETVPLTGTRPRDGWSEQDPGDWLAATDTVLTALGGRADLGAVAGIGLSGHMHGVVLLDAVDRVLRPCMMWNDTRAHDQAARMDAEPGWREITGNIVFPGFSAPKAAWVRETEPETWDRVSACLLPKDFLRLYLTGERVAEMSDASGTAWLDVGARDWSDDLLARSGLDRAAVGRLVEGAEVSGGLRAVLAQRHGLPEGVPVAGGAGDNASSAIGMGVVARGQAFVSLGTSGVLFAATEGFSPRPETAVHSFCHALAGTWHQMGVILSATDSLNWAARLMGEDPAALTAGLDELRAPGRPVFLPYLGGERTPLNSATARGAFLGLDHATDRAAATRAVIEGVTFALRDCRDALAETGTAIDSLVAVGGGSRSDYWLEAIATALDVPVDVPQAGEYGAALGAARLGRMAATGDTAAAAPPVARRIEPVEALSDAFAAGHARYRDAARFAAGFG
ncbi:xylulokinase [Palleronia sediminis]|uniref:Xylulose kinase n=1 Tax=Palleronia sediminis TaxID=2547833 RepID=A0A4R6AC08_9RHOB|nr:xylulokinase [Palleronia sediminis]TDL81350.1 xylulokinase [Palleronia sediminis]